MALKKHRKYIVHFTLPDGRHVAVMDSIVIEGEEDAKFVTSACMMALSQNPDAKLDDIVPMQSMTQLQGEVDKLKAENTNRPLADDLVAQGVIDEPNRLLTNPEIPRGLAALYTPG